MYEIVYDGVIIQYSINKKLKKKNISINVKSPDIVTVTAPHYVSDEYIHDIVKSKSKWISNKLNNFKYLKSKSKLLVTGDKLLYLGKEYELVVTRVSNRNIYSLDFIDNKFIATIPHHVSQQDQTHSIYDLLKSFYIKNGTLLAIDKVKIYSEIIGANPKLVKIKDQKTSWGSCSSLGNIYLNWRIFLAPSDIIDYVIVHELCHLIHMNHSTEYWDLVGVIMPDYKQRREWLKANGNLLKIS